jgi:2'-5' RNA ligase
MAPRWFIAFPFAHEAALSGFAPPPPAVRLFTADDLHLTLAFLGRCGEASARAAFATIAPASIAPFVLGLGRAELLGGSRPTAIARGVVERCGRAPRPVQEERSEHAPRPVQEERCEHAPRPVQRVDEPARLSATMARLRGAALEAASAPPDDRPPRPHLTIGRVERRASDAERERVRAWMATIEPRPERLEADAIALYTTADDRSRRRYRIVARRRLGIP